MKGKSETDEEMVARILGDAIKQRRTAAKLSQGKLGDYLGVSFQQVQKYELGTNRLPVVYLVKLARLFKCTLNDFVSDAFEQVSQPVPRGRVKNYLLVPLDDENEKARPYTGRSIDEVSEKLTIVKVTRSKKSR